MVLAEEVVIISWLVSDEDDLLSAWFRRGLQLGLQSELRACATDMQIRRAEAMGRERAEPATLTRWSVSHKRPLAV